jgi:hypothetical protein
VQAVSQVEIDAVVENLLSLSTLPEGQFGLESLGKYQDEVISAKEPILVIFFCDDYIESIIDIKRFELILDINPTLTVLYIPRNGRYGNDIAYEDMELIFNERQFKNLHHHIDLGRFLVSPDGPRSGCIDPRYISPGLIETIRSCGKGKKVIFETKGCRNFEMLRGDLRVPWYTGFNCNRALSIRTVGIDGPPVFMRIPPGLKAYDGFTQPVTGTSPSYQLGQVLFARMTTRQLFRALRSPVYQTLLDHFVDELELNQLLSEQGEKKGLPVNEMILNCSAREITT